MKGSKRREKRQHCGCPTWSAVDEVEVYRRVRRMPPGRVSLPQNAGTKQRGDSLHNTCV
ncbi:hypothetical protein [Brevibacillus sp. H7]|uniref:hypothetical protein n=1 Tax=Brevibacillus sp. H7 TaxID=3349138 RepID=UPI0037F24A04